MSHSSVSEIWERECRHGKHREREGGGGHGERERINRKTMKRQKERLKVCVQVGEKMRKRDGWMDGEKAWVITMRVQTPPPSSSHPAVYSADNRLSLIQNNCINSNKPQECPASVLLCHWEGI